MLYECGSIAARIPPEVWSEGASNDVRTLPEWPQCSSVTPQCWLTLQQQLAVLLFDSILPWMRSECFECCWNVVRIFGVQSECCWTALWMPFDIFPVRMYLESFEHEQNIRAGHKNGPEYLECTQNTVRIFRMHFEYPGMCQEFSFRVLTFQGINDVTWLE